MGAKGGGEGDIWRNVVSPGPAMKIRSFSTLFETKIVLDCGLSSS